MCGIAGFYGFRDDTLIKKFSGWLKHRGPDGDGFYLADEATLLNRRLAIIDVKGGDQPIYNEDKTVVVVYNGEIYNYRELRKELEEKGHVFSTKTDTEIIVHGYEEWGEDAFARYNGMFGVALWDSKKKKLILARDHFGIKPLYFAVAGGKVVFSSEIKPIIWSGLIEVKPNDKTIYRYLKYRVHDDGRETFFEGVERLLPGELMVIENGKRTVRKFTDIQEKLLELSGSGNNKEFTKEDITRFGDLLTDSIKRRLVSEVPVGTCLSGGLDSSTVVAVANKLLSDKESDAQALGERQNTFSAVFPGSRNDEEKYIDELLSQMKSVRSHKVRPTAKDFFADLADFVKTQEEPTISTGPYAQYQVMRRAHEEVKVLLDGQGADEMMAGYLPYYFVYLRQLWKEKKLAKLAGEVVSSRDVLMKYFAGKIGARGKSQAAAILNKEFASRFPGEKFPAVTSNLKKRLVRDIFANSLQSLLRYEDKNAMRFSIEGRVPFLDFRLVEYIFSLPDEAIIKEGWNKYVLREATRNLLPALINRRRNKIGFTTPEHEWFMKNGDTFLSYFTGERFEAKKYVNQARVVVAFKEFLSGKSEDSMLFWRILNLELWLREFFPAGEKKSPSLPKKITNVIEAGGGKYFRFPVRTGVFGRGDDVPEKVVGNLSEALPKLLKDNPELMGREWFAVVSEKIVATAQGRAYFIWDINPSPWAHLLSRFVSRVPWGIGLGSPWTMQLAIEEVGLPRIFAAAVAGGIGKAVGKKGLFYQLAGRSAAGIDGPTEYSLYPANVSAKLLPKDPQTVCSSISDRIRKAGLPEQFKGTAIIDANDIGRNVLGNSTGLSDRLVEEIFRDNPMGQTNEQTPVTVVVKL